MLTQNAVFPSHSWKMLSVGRWSIIFYLICPALNFPALADQPDVCAIKVCVGTSPQDHNESGYDFASNSRVYKSAGAFVYETCVQNKSDRTLYVRWLVPSWSQWIPKGCAHADTSRRFLKDKREATAKGCLVYGNSWHTTKAAFWIHKSEEKKITDEDTAGCQAWQQTAGIDQPSFEDTTGSVVPIAFHTELFAPTDAKYAEESLARISINVSIEPQPSSKKVVHKISYSINALPGATSLSDIPFLLVPSDKLAFTWANINDTKLLAKGGSISAEVPLPSNPALLPVRYDFLTIYGQPVASTNIPVYVEAEQN